ncbi:MAG: hypothetical protein HDS04_04620 [Bacteroides sp.]|nr:hypothetical protein [Bacteroides sp.]
MNKTLISAFLALVSAGIAFGQCPLTFVGSDQAQIGVYVAPVNESEPTVAYNSEVLLTPASVMKSVTVAAALHRYGGDFRWQTVVKSSGKIADGTLRGNLVFIGSGDPTLGSYEFRKNRTGFLAALRSAAADKGFSHVAGCAVDASSWPNQGAIPSWEIEDIPGVDGAGFYGLNWNDNTFNLSVPSMQASPRIPGLQIKRRASSGGLSAFRNPGSYEITVTGQLGNKQKSATLKCSMPYPPEVLLGEVDSLFSARKEKFNGGDTATVLVYRSPELREVARSLMIRSDNQMAEATLRLLEPRQPRAKAIATERAILTGLGVDLKGARIADGSGLSRHNAISPRQLGQILRSMARNGDYVGSFARVGLDGTVRNFMKTDPNRENFVLKSGSMTGVICYVGYRLDPQTKSPTHVLAIMINNAPDSKAARAAIASFLSSL